MTTSIIEIIETAVKLNPKILEDYLYEMQSQSNLNPKVFFGLLKSELEEIKKRDKEEIDKLKKSGLMLFYKYDLLDIVINSIFETELLKIELTPKMARILGYEIKLNEKHLGKSLIPGNEDEQQSIENKFNQMPFEEVRSHFLPLIKKENPKREIWMTEEDFDIFLRRSFGGQTNLPKPNINIGNRGKFAIVKLFHNFYEKTLDHPYNGPREIDEVFNLLKDAFNTPTFEKERKDNFKSGKSKYKW